MRKSDRHLYNSHTPKIKIKTHKDSQVSVPQSETLATCYIIWFIWGNKQTSGLLENTSWCFWILVRKSWCGLHAVQKQSYDPKVERGAKQRASKVKDGKTIASGDAEVGEK